MCGICGVVSFNSLEPANENIIKLLKETEARGRDSWGFYAFNLDDSPVTKDTHRQLWKITTTPKKFEKEHEGSLDLSNVGCLFAHTRASTNGDASNHKNNHPFVSKDFVLAHNGTISQHKEIKKSLNLDYDSECDSPVILFAIQKHFDDLEEIEDIDERMIEAIQKGVEDVNSGNFSCWLVHKESRRMFFFRNTYPFEYAFLEDGSFVFASVKSYIRDSFDVPYNEIEETEAYRIYELIADEEDKGLHLEVVAEIPKGKKITGRNTQSGRATTSYGSHYNHPNRKKSQARKETSFHVENYEMVANRLKLLDSKIDVDFTLSMRTNGNWVLSSNQKKFMDLVNGMKKWAFQCTEGEYCGEPFLMLPVTDEEVNEFLDDFEEQCYEKGWFEPENKGAKFLAYLASLDGVFYATEHDKIVVRAHDRIARENLKAIGLTTNIKGECKIKASSIEALGERLEYLMSAKKI